MTNKITLPTYPILKAAKVYFDASPVRQHIIDHYEGVEYDSVDGFVRDLQSSSWQHGSFGLIYNNEIENIMNNGEFRSDVYSYYNKYAESLDSPIADLCDQTILAIALEMAANEIASQIECSAVEVVVEYEDNEDNNPRLRYTTDYSARDICDDIINRRMYFITSNSKRLISEDKLTSIMDELDKLVYVL